MQGMWAVYFTEISTHKARETPSCANNGALLGVEILKVNHITQNTFYNSRKNSSCQVTSVPTLSLLSTKIITTQFQEYTSVSHTGEKYSHWREAIPLHGMWAVLFVECISKWTYAENTFYI